MNSINLLGEASSIDGMLSGKEQFDKEKQMVKDNIQKQPRKNKEDRER